MSSLADVEEKVAGGGTLADADIALIASWPDLPRLGTLGERSRQARHGNRVTFVRVCEVGDGTPSERGEAGEVRLIGAPASLDDAKRRVHDALRFAAGVPLTGFSAGHLLRLAAGDEQALTDIAATLEHEGLESLGETALDELGDVGDAVRIINAIRRSGLETWRATVSAADFAGRQIVIRRAQQIQSETGAFKSFAPLPGKDPREQPSTGYDDVRTIVLARLICRDVPSIQVDWQLYGPKLAQVAIAYGADDLDRVSALDAPESGRRRAPREEITRHIRMAFAEPVERDGRYETFR